MSDFDWRYLPSTPHGVAGQFAGVHNNAIIFAGGTNWENDAGSHLGKTKAWLDTTYILNPNSKRWTTTRRLSTASAYGASASFGGGIVCVGGAGAQRHHTEAFVLDWSNGNLTQTSLPSLPTANAYGSGAILDNVMYVFGGLESADATEANRAFWSLDLNNLSAGWIELEPWLGPARILPAAVATEGAVYLFSGCTVSNHEISGSDYLSDAYCYRPGSGWENISDLPKPAAASSAVAYGRAIYVFSGVDDSSVEPQTGSSKVEPGFSPDVMRFDLHTCSWSYAGTIPHTYVTTRALNWQNEIVVLPGEPDSAGSRGRKVMIGKPQ